MPNAVLFAYHVLPLPVIDTQQQTVKLKNSANGIDTERLEKHLATSPSSWIWWLSLVFTESSYCSLHHGWSAECEDCPDFDGLIRIVSSLSKFETGKDTKGQANRSLQASWLAAGCGEEVRYKPRSLHLISWRPFVLQLCWDLCGYCQQGADKAQWLPSRPALQDQAFDFCCSKSSSRLCSGETPGIFLWKKSFHTSGII